MRSWVERVFRYGTRGYTVYAAGLGSVVAEVAQQRSKPSVCYWRVVTDGGSAIYGGVERSVKAAQQRAEERVRLVLSERGCR